MVEYSGPDSACQGLFFGTAPGPGEQAFFGSGVENPSGFRYHGLPEKVFGRLGTEAGDTSDLERQNRVDS